MRKSILWISSIIFICLSLFTIPAFAKEVIESFDSLIQVQTDGSMIVTETLRVHHEGIKIRRGIYRDLPFQKGEKYELISVRRDNNPEPSFTEKSRMYYRINTGNDNYLPHPQTSTFEIKYKVWNIPQSYDGYDEVYWNVTGDEWNFPIEKVSAKIELPEGADIIQQASYIGSRGSKGSATYEGRGEYTGRYLEPGEQLTIAVGFTPGIVATKKHILISDFFDPVLSFVLYLIYLLILIVIWDQKGRDPDPHAVMPIYEPPKDITAAQAAVLCNRSGINLFAISLIQMISNGFLKMTTKEEPGFILSQTTYILERTDKQPSNEEENCLVFDKTEKITLDGKYQKKIDKLAKRIEIRANSAKRGKSNAKLVFYPTFIALWLLFCLWGRTALLNQFEDGWLLFCGFFAFHLAFWPVNFTYTSFRRCCATVLVELGIAIYFLVNGDSYWPTIVLFLFMATQAIFAYLMYKPTEQSARLVEQLEGLKLFLKTIKVSQKDKKNIDEKCMEKLFPYALALGVEKYWEDKFVALFGLRAYQAFEDTHAYIISHSFHSDFSHSAAACSTAPSSGGGGSGFSSGSGGGGCSGGGGGGGGGGGR